MRDDVLETRFEQRQLAAHWLSEESKSQKMLGNSQPLLPRAIVPICDCPLDSQILIVRPDIPKGRESEVV
jgi:hypothetical protein